MRSNRTTADYLHTLTAVEDPDIQVRVGSPTGGCVHSRRYLVREGDEQWSAVNSLNGSEISRDLNCEVMLLVDHLAVDNRRLDVVLHDWALTIR